MNLLITRLLASILLFVLTFVVGFVPVYWYQKIRRKAERNPILRSDSNGHKTTLSANFYVQIITQIGGGILFFTVFAHSIPEVRNNFEKYLKSNHSIFANQLDEKSPKSIEDLSLPYLEIAICLGFFIIYFTEVLMHSMLDTKHKPIIIRNDSLLEDKKVDPIVNNNVESTSETSQSGKDDNECDETSAIIRPKCNHLIGSHSEDHNISIVIDHRMDDPESMEPMIVRFLHGLVIITSFSIHSIFDGISIGVRTESSDMWTMFIAIASHKLMIALIIGVELYEKCSNVLFVVFHMILFSVMSPIGVFIVILFEQSIDTHSETNGVVILLSAIASGSILYIVFFEILQRDRVSKLSPIIQFLSMALGFIVMFALATTLTEE